MGKLIASINVTVDGYCNHDYVVADIDLHEYACSVVASSEAVLFGSRTFKIFEDYWPSVSKSSEYSVDQIEFAEKITSIRKIVFSKSLKSSDWLNVEFTTEELRSKILNLKKTVSGDLLTFGSPTLLMSLASLDLVDEYHFLIQPMIMGSGRMLTEGLKSKLNFRLTGVRQFSSGVVFHSYTR